MSQIKDGFIDADTHVIENADTWAHMTGEDAVYRPTHARSEDGRSFFLSGGRFIPHRYQGGRPDWYQEGVPEMRNVPARIAQMDELGVDVQVLFTSFFISASLGEAENEIALCRSYNRWMAQIWRAGGGRFRWVAVPPLRTMNVALEEIEFARENGACGIQMFSAEMQRKVSDRYYDPLYAKAQALDLPLCVHIGAGDQGLRGRGTGFMVTYVVATFWEYFASDVLERFPQLRIGFFEAGSAWVPYVLHMFNNAQRMQPERDGRLYVTLMPGDDLPYLLAHSGGVKFMAATDFGHFDDDVDLGLHRKILARTDVVAPVKSALVRDNARELFAL